MTIRHTLLYYILYISKANITCPSRPTDHVPPIPFQFPKLEHLTVVELLNIDSVHTKECKEGYHCFVLPENVHKCDEIECHNSEDVEILTFKFNEYFLNSMTDSLNLLANLGLKNYVNVAWNVPKFVFKGISISTLLFSCTMG